MGIFHSILLLSMLACLLPSTVHAHHPGHGAPSGSLGTRNFLLQGSPAKPASRVFLAYEGAQLDEGLGQAHTVRWGGEYSFNRRVSVLADAPVTHIAYNFRSNETGLGDIALQGKLLLWESAKTFAFASSQWSLPTGDEDKGLGRGAVGQEVTGLFGLQAGPWLLFAATGANFGYESSVEPVWLASAGLHSPRFFNERLSFHVALSSQVFLDSAILTAGSAKLYAEPGANLFFGARRNWAASLSARASVVDTLERKPGVNLTLTDPSLLSDVRWGGSFSLNYQF